MLEVMVAILVLSIGILGLAPLFVVSMYGNSFSNEMTRANLLATEQIETLKGFSSFSPMPYTRTETGLEGVFTRQTRVDDSSTDVSVPVGVYALQITVSWIDQSGVARAVNYLTYKGIEE
jgi:Tfp pilus assembly protein PilV